MNWKYMCIQQVCTFFPHYGNASKKEGNKRCISTCSTCGSNKKREGNKSIWLLIKIMSYAFVA